LKPNNPEEESKLIPKKIRDKKKVIASYYIKAAIIFIGRVKIIRK